MTDKSNVLILGYGEMGHAMEHLLVGRHHLSIWNRSPVEGLKVAVLEKTVPEADFILFCLPINPHREIVTQIQPLLNKDSICLSIAKGLDEAGRTAAQIFEEVMNDKNQYALIYGPMISEEIRADRYAFAQVGCLNKQSYTRTKELFNGSKLFMEYTSDIHGISWSVVLKNVYAILFGIADGLQLGDNVRGFLMVQSLLELDKIVKQMGGVSGASCHLAGLGDLVTTATSKSSHHYQLGISLAIGNVQAIIGEGIHSLEMVKKHQLYDDNDYPLYKLIHDIVRNPKIDIKQIINNYISNAY